MSPGDAENHYNFSLLLRAQGRDSAADEHLNTAHELAPTEWDSAQQPASGDAEEASSREMDGLTPQEIEVLSNRHKST